MAVKNMAASILTRLKNQSKQEKIPFQLILQLFAQEEFLRKLSRSTYVNHLILKGGMFIYTLTEFDSRPTRDIDFLLRNLHGSLTNIEQSMRDICNVVTGNSYIILDVIGTEPISVEKKYPGIRTNFIGKIERVRIPFSIDIGIDDIIIPNPIQRHIVTRLPEFEPPLVYTYSLESTIAEKFDAILQRMSGTSRMKDFYDIYYLSGIFDFQGKILTEAISKTLIQRERELDKDAFKDISSFKNNTFLQKQWNAFEPAREANLSFEETILRLIYFLEPIYQCILENTLYTKNWDCEHQAWIEVKSKEEK